LSVDEVAETTPAGAEEAEDEFVDGDSVDGALVADADPANADTAARAELRRRTHSQKMVRGL
jgi:hypothetical protein